MTGRTEINILLSGQQEAEGEIMIALLADFGFEGFREEDGRIYAYIQPEKFNQTAFEAYLSPFAEYMKSYRISSIDSRNWNEEWEKSYSPVEISGNCCVRAPFHPSPGKIDYDILISPRMSFGTAHHETTRLMMETMLDREWKGKTVLDLGCGTGILAILAEKMGAEKVLAVDNDPLACQNALGNVELNNCRSITVEEGECASVSRSGFEAVLGNINLNVLLQDMHCIAKRISAGGVAILSGYYEDDLQQLDARAGECGLSTIAVYSLNLWTVAVYRKAE